MSIALSENYRRLLAQCESDKFIPNAVLQWNDLADLYPLTHGEPYQLRNEYIIDLDDVVLTIASVWLGLRQIKYPFSITMGRPDFYHKDGGGNCELDVLPKYSDAFIFPVDLTEVSSQSSTPRKRKRIGPQEESEAKRQAHGSEDRPAPPNIALAVCEPSGKDFTNFSIDIHSLRSTSDLQERARHIEAIFVKFKRSLAAARWHVPVGAEDPADLGFNLRDVVGPQLGERKESYMAILNAWAYLLDLPVKDGMTRHDCQVRETDFFSEAFKLFNLALKGRLTFKLLQAFLEDTGFAYAKDEATSHLCIPQPKYRRHLVDFCSVSVHKDGDKTWEGQLQRFLQREFILGPQRMPNCECAIFKQWNTRLVKQAIGTLWRTSFDANFPYTPDDGGFAFYDDRYRVASESDRPAAKSPLLMVHSVRGAKAKKWGKYERFKIFSVVEADLDCFGVQSSDHSQAVCITHYGVYAKLHKVSRLEKAAEETVKQCGWHNSTNVSQLQFKHRYAESPVGIYEGSSAIYAVLFGWARLLGLPITELFCVTDESLDNTFFRSAMVLINLAFQGRTTLGAIEAFLVSWNICGETRQPTNICIGEQTMTTCPQWTIAAVRSALHKKYEHECKEGSKPEVDAISNYDLGEFICAQWKELDQPNCPETTFIEDEQGGCMGSGPQSSSSRALSQGAASQGTPPEKAPSRNGSGGRAASTTQITTGPGFKKLASKSNDTSSKVAHSKCLSVETGRRKVTPPQRGEQSETHTQPTQESLQLVPEISPYRDPKHFTYYDASEFDHLTNDRNKATSEDQSKNVKRKKTKSNPNVELWKAEFEKHLKICKDREKAKRKQQRKSAAEKGPSKTKDTGGSPGLKPFSEHNEQNPEAGTAMEHVGNAIAALWEPLWDSSIKYGFSSGDLASVLCDKEFASAAGMGAAAGGPYPFIIPTYSSEILPSPAPGAVQSDGVGHIWLAVAVLRQPQPSNPPNDASEVSPDLGKLFAERAATKGRAAKKVPAAKTLDPGGETLGKKNYKKFIAELKPKDPHVDLYIYDSWEEGIPHGEPNRRVQKSKNMVRYSGWAVGSNIVDPGPQYYPRYWYPTIKVHHVPCPQQTDQAFGGRVNSCGMFAILNAWAVMLGLTPRSAPKQKDTVKTGFWELAFELFDLAELGCLSTRTIQAFFNSRELLDSVQELNETVVDVWTIENRDTYNSKLGSIVEQTEAIMASKSQRNTGAGQLQSQTTSKSRTQSKSKSQ